MALYYCVVSDIVEHYNLRKKQGKERKQNAERNVDIERVF